MSTLVQAAPVPEAPFRQHYPRQQSQHNTQVYTAAVPMEQSDVAAPGSSQPTLYKQINIIPGLDADNAVVDTGIKLVRPTGGQVQVSANTTAANEFDGKRMRRSIQRRTVDYNASAIQMLKHRLYKKSLTQKPVVHPDPLYYVDIVQPRSILDNPINSVTTRFVRASTNKIRCPVFTVAWTPEGRRVVTGTSSGEFTLWNGLTFNFETILQAHESAVRAMEWSHNDMWLLSGDHNGVIKYWQSNMNNVKMIQAHTDPIRGLSFCPTDNKFVTCSDDGLLKVWDFYRCSEESVLKGHGADVKCCGWHPSKSLIASGSKDSQQPLKLWDPRSGASLATIHGHKSTVMDLQWNKNGNWILTGSRDRLLKVYDIRVMKDICTFRGHKKEAASVNWHPLYEEMFASGGSDGSIMFWLMGCEKELGVMDCAHDGMIWDLKWHPLGHILCSGSNDHTTKFWTRNRPADKMRDKYNLNVLPPGFEDDYEYELPDVATSDGIPAVSDSTTTMDIPPKGKVLPTTTTAATTGKCNLNTPAVKALLEQASLEVSKPDSTDAPAQVYTLSQLRPTAPAFKIDSSKQQEAINEVERLEKRRERQLRKGADKGQKRHADSDDDTPKAPSLLDLDIAPPAFIQEQEMKEKKEREYMDEMNKRQQQANMAQAQRALSHGQGPQGMHQGQGPPLSPRSGMPLPNWHRNENENENRNFDGPGRPFQEGRPPQGGPVPFDRPPHDRPQPVGPQGGAQGVPQAFDRPHDRPMQVGPQDRPPQGQPEFNRPPQDRPPLDRPPQDRPPQERQPQDRPNYDRPPNDSSNFNRPPQGGPHGPPGNAYMDGARPNEHFDNRPRPNDEFADRPRPAERFDNRPRPIDDRPRPDGEFMNGPPPPRSVADFPNRPREEEFNGPRPGNDFPNRPRQDENIRDGPPGPAGDFDKRQRANNEEFNAQPSHRLGGDFDLRPLPDAKHANGKGPPPAGEFDKRPPDDTLHRHDMDAPRFDRGRSLDGPPPRFNSEQQPPQLNGPRFEGPPIDNRGPPPSGGPPRHNAPFDGPPNAPPRNNERFIPRDNFAPQKRWEDQHMSERWREDGPNNMRPNDMRPNDMRPNDNSNMEDRGPNWENVNREGIHRENRERLR